MNNYDLHERAQLLADTHSAYELARMVAKFELTDHGVKISSEPTEIIGPVTVTINGVPSSINHNHLGASTTACDDQFAADPNGDDHD